MIFKETKIDSIMFDLDGTLWNPTAITLKALQLAVEKIPEITQKITANDVRSIFGLQHNQVIKKLFPYLDESVQKKIDIAASLELNLLAKSNACFLFDNVENVLKTLKSNYPLFIVSNCQKGYIETFLERNNFQDYFIDYECSGNTGQNKAFNIKHVITRNNLQHPVYIGDTQIDADASKENNIPFIYAKYGFGEVEEHSYAIEDIAELLKFFIV